MLRFNSLHALTVAERQGRRITGAPSARYRHTADDRLDVEVGFPLSGGIAARGRVEPTSQPAGRAATTIHAGDYSGIGAAYDAAVHWITEHGYVPSGDPWESYLDGPGVAAPRTEVFVPCAERLDATPENAAQARADPVAERSIRDCEPRPLPLRVAAPRLARCAARTMNLLARHRLHQPERNMGRRMTFADGTTGVVYRETVACDESPRDPSVLVVSFRLRGAHGWGHALFQAERLLNTPLFAGFPGFVSKLWLTADDLDRYRGFYQWDGTRPAEDYVRALWWALALVSHRHSIRYCILPGQLRDDVLEGARSEEWSAPPDQAWWRLVRTETGST
ncbi:GyrI-like domain-containing protein [Rhodococcus koreensis]|uniref:GyrI-like small molecule binding domain-containing protein n=1 Tax=Rhodococcus koreensis TaxID=99653 RepID=A0A1H4IDS1_9NOCA|nr:GyrI-like domain-containing protein [Rhodococcus koreensis]SEB31846.1 GyrI-like small molecule binding domain-containing protein [Rhodococcus koreensis]